MANFSCLVSLKGLRLRLRLKFARCSPWRIVESYLVVREEKHGYRVIRIRINLECGHRETARLHLVARFWAPVLCAFRATSLHHSDRNYKLEIIAKLFRQHAIANEPIDIPGSHNDDEGLLFPYHPPEIPACFWQRTLGTDERVLLFVTVNEIRIYVIRRGISVYLRQTHSTVIVTKHVRVPILRLVRSQSEKYI